MTASPKLAAPLANPARRRLLSRAGAGVALAALPGASAFAQREGVQVGPPSQISALAPSAEQVEAQAGQEYRQLLQQASAKNKLAYPTHPQVIRLNYISQRLRQFAPMWNPRASGWQWEVSLIGSDQVNAFCMPGGKIAFYWGILDKLKLSDAEVSMIMGHEMTHALRDHAREQMGKQTATNLGITALSAIFRLGQAGQQLAGMGGQMLGLKYSRDDETEADLVGLELAARAGYDPNAAISLWEKMEAQSNNGAPPALLSDHPSNPDRMSTIRRNIPNVIGLYDRAPKPDCSFGPPGAPATSCASAMPRPARSGQAEGGDNWRRVER
jgi:Zn-dependent protease with chaperone function